jgi:hypothetical protein
LQSNGLSKVEVFSRKFAINVDWQNIALFEASCSIEGWLSISGIRYRNDASSANLAAVALAG